MNRVRSVYEKWKDVILPCMGVLAVSVMVLPYLILGQGSYVEIHDQMDGEILNYIYHAKYMFRGDVIPEFMNGMTKAAMMPPAPLGVFFYVFLHPFWAYVAMQWFVLVVGFEGMYFLCKKCGVKQEIGFLVGCLFAYMPFYPTYGLAALGQPLLILCFWNILQGEKKLFSLLGMAVYAGFSSLTLIGYLWIALGCMSVCYFLFGKHNRKMAAGALAATGVMLVVYVVTNLDLLKALFFSGAGEFVTHRTEMKLQPTENLLAKMVDLLFEGGSYSKVYSSLILMAVIGILVWGGFCRVKGRTFASFGYVRKIARLLELVLFGIILAVAWNCEAVVSLRKEVGGVLESFQADRVYWIFPFLWMLILAFVLEVLWNAVRLSGKTIVKVVAATMALLLLVGEGAQILRDNPLNKNARLVLLDNYQQVTWESLYMEDTFAQIDAVIGGDKGVYSVVSLGMYPSVALYNGYTCADGYSNNYDLAYKHRFREIMEEELAENEEVRSYFDDWGNRLYLASSSYGMNAMIGKNSGLTFRELDYNTDAMKELNVKYLFAAAPIENAEELGMELVDGSPFKEERGFYEVWVYHVF